MKFKIKSKKIRGKFIKGNLLERKGASTLVIFVSGLDGGGDFSLFKKSSSYFYKKGFNVIRFNFCSYRSADSVKLEEMSFSTYATELKNVIDSFSKKNAHIVLVGHSFGSVVAILFLSTYKKYTKHTSVVLWEPTLLPWKRKWMKEDFVFDRDMKLYRSKQNEEVLNGTFYEECISTTSTAKMLGSLNMRALIVAAEGSADTDAKKYFSKIHNKKTSKLVILQNTNHYFDDNKTQEELFRETTDFLKNTGGC